MFTRILLAVSLMIAVLLTILFEALPTNAQTAPTASCSDPTYGNAFAGTGAIVKAVNAAKPGTVGAALLAVMKARYQYETTTPPSGCESAKPVLVQILSTEEDTLYTIQAASSDPANKAAYADVAGSAATRLKTIGAALNAVFPGASATTPKKNATRTLTPSPTLTGAPEPSPIAPHVCADAAFGAQVVADWSIFQSNQSGKNVTAVIKLRYKYEDLTAPIGCEDGRTVLIQTFTGAEDQAALNIMTFADVAQSSAYSAFLTKTVFAHFAVVWNATIAAFAALGSTATASETPYPTETEYPTYTEFPTIPTDTPFRTPTATNTLRAFDAFDLTNEAKRDAIYATITAQSLTATAAFCDLASALCSK